MVSVELDKNESRHEKVRACSSLVLRLKLIVLRSQSELSGIDGKLLLSLLRIVIIVVTIRSLLLKLL